MTSTTEALQRPGWWIFSGDGVPHDGIVERLPPAPPWRTRRVSETLLEREPPSQDRAALVGIDSKVLDVVNASLYLRRPILVTGDPGIGKSSLAAALAYELQLGKVLAWRIGSRSTIKDGLYDYDAVGRLHETSAWRSGGTNAEHSEGRAEIDLGRYVRLGALGTALLPSHRPRVLLIDEIDKSDIDFPNDLLHVLEEGAFDIPELARLPEEKATVDVFTADRDRVPVHRGHVQCSAFPIIVMTSNGERELPPAFLRRCLRADIPFPKDPETLKAIVRAHLGVSVDETTLGVAVQQFIERLDRRDRLAVDQLMNVAHLLAHAAGGDASKLATAIDAALRPLGNR